MTTHIDWNPAGDSLNRLYDELTDASDNWPTPKPDNAFSTDEQRRLARTHWCRRIGATYVTVARANALSQSLIALGAPVDIIAGASYASDELTHHLAMLVHLVRPLQPRCAPTISRSQLVQPAEVPSWSDVFARTVDLYLFNLQLSAPTYEAISAVSSDPAIRRLAAMLAASIESLVDFGSDTLDWMSDQLPPAAPEAMTAHLPERFSAYETLCCGNPELLDALAGEEFTLEMVPGNLGTLRANQIAVAFYDTLSTAILPKIEQLGCHAAEAWQRHYHAGADCSPTAVVASVAATPTG